MPKFSDLTEAIEIVISQSSVTEDSIHSKNTLQWLLRLNPDADEGLQIAALGHDIERAIEERKVKRQDFEDYDAFKQAHARNSAGILRELMREKGINDPKLIGDVFMLVCRHEVGGDPRSDLLRDADSLSYFDVNLPHYYQRNGREETLRRCRWGYRRLSERGKAILKEIRHEDEDLQGLLECCQDETKRSAPMNVEERTDILVVGHYVHDTLITEAGERHETLGGPPAYISAILDDSGASYSVISKVGTDFKYSREVQRAPIVLPDSFTTAFVNDCSRGTRRQSVDAVCGPILPDDITGNATVGIACGVFNEILPETLLRLRKKCDVLVADIQGFLRVRHDDHSVGHLDIENTPYASVLDYIDFLKVSDDEARSVDIDSLRKRTRIILTKGERGCQLYERDLVHTVPANAAAVKDDTGAGDCFIAGFALGLSKGLDVFQAAKLGNRCGALAVRHVGIPRLPKGEIEALVEDGANLVRSLMKAGRIDSHIANFPHSVHPAMVDGLGRFETNVPSEDTERAVKLIDARGDQEH